MNKKKILTLLLSLSLVLGLNPAISANASEITQKDITSATSNSQSNMNAERKAFEKKYGKSKVKLDVNTPLTITLDDGTKIRYSLEITNDTNPMAKKEKNSTLSSSTLAASTRTLKVSKEYFKNVFGDGTKISSNARCKFSGRSVQITDVWADTGSSQITLSNTSKIEEEYGYNNSYATCYSRGTAVTSGGAKENYFLGMEIDPAGAAYLSSDSY
ncbi:hypothetical protein [Clostridium sp. C2-6-12]|uniref:hypothetical protein n=1 Tax=Clostridium sp. C2-6-12 TaxID=2698832 RepID=UPI00136DC0AC|nr:hypothetical protein [Clostridium sp. C2-6-12]